MTQEQTRKILDSLPGNIGSAVSVDDNGDIEAPAALSDALLNTLIEALHDARENPAIEIDGIRRRMAVSVTCPGCGSLTPGSSIVCKWRRLARWEDKGLWVEPKPEPTPATLTIVVPEAKRAEIEAAVKAVGGEVK